MWCLDPMTEEMEVSFQDSILHGPSFNPIWIISDRGTLPTLSWFLLLKLSGHQWHDMPASWRPVLEIQAQTGTPQAKTLFCLSVLKSVALLIKDKVESTGSSTMFRSCPLPSSEVSCLAKHLHPPKTNYILIYSNEDPRGQQGGVFSLDPRLITSCSILFSSLSLELSALKPLVMEAFSKDFREQWVTDWWLVLPAGSHLCWPALGCPGLCLGASPANGVKV